MDPHQNPTFPCIVSFFISLDTKWKVKKLKEEIMYLRWGFLFLVTGFVPIISLWFKSFWILWNIQPSLDILLLWRKAHLWQLSLFYFPQRDQSQQSSISNSLTLNKNCFRAWESLWNLKLTFSHYHCRYQLHWKGSLFYFIFNYLISELSRTVKTSFSHQKKFYFGDLLLMYIASQMTNKTK